MDLKEIERKLRIKIRSAGTSKKRSADTTQKANITTNETVPTSKNVVPLREIYVLGKKRKTQVPGPNCSSLNRNTNGEQLKSNCDESAAPEFYRPSQEVEPKEVERQNRRFQRIQELKQLERHRRDANSVRDLGNGGECIVNSKTLGRVEGYGRRNKYVRDTISVRADLNSSGTEMRSIKTEPGTGTKSKALANGVKSGTTAGGSKVVSRRTLKLRKREAGVVDQRSVKKEDRKPKQKNQKITTKEGVNKPKTEESGTNAEISAPGKPAKRGKKKKKKSDNPNNKAVSVRHFPKTVAIAKVKLAAAREKTPSVQLKRPAKKPTNQTDSLAKNKVVLKAKDNETFAAFIANLK